jgi:homoserine dehydrogenase
MTPALTVTLVIGVVGSGGVGVLVGAILTHRRESKRDKADATVRYAEALQTRLRDVETQVDGLWAARRDDAKRIRAMGDHIDVLEAHIWRGDPPPPPARPDGI